MFEQVELESSFEIAHGQGGPVRVGRGNSLLLICGPCVMESLEHSLVLAESIRDIANRQGMPMVFKASYDKANRTSIQGFRGLGREEGLNILEKVRDKTGVPVLTDVHSSGEAELVGSLVDVIQIPAFLCRQTDILIAAGRTAKPVLIKKGQFLAAEDMRYAAEKVAAGGGRRVMLCERGNCFGSRDLVVDFRSFEIMAETGCPVVFDATHSVQVMGGACGSSGGNRRFVPLLARAAVAAGVEGVFLETHEDPSRSPSDGPNMIPLEKLEQLLMDLRALHDMKLETRFAS